MHDLLNFSAMLLSGVLGALLVTPTGRGIALVRERIEERLERR